jgi:hypothetical protein
MLMVLEMAPEMKGWTAAIREMWACQGMDLPEGPEGVAVSKTERWPGSRPSAPSTEPFASQWAVMAAAFSAEYPRLRRASSTERLTMRNQPPPASFLCFTKA